MFPLAAQSAEYLVNNEADLRSAIDTANTNGDTSAVIKLGANVTMASGTSFPTPTMPVTIDTNGFTLTREGLPAAASIPVNMPGQYTFNGNFVGTPNGIVQGTGLTITGAGIQNSVVLNGNATGGNRTGNTGGGAVGVNVNGSITFINNGNVKGGQAISLPANNFTSSGLAMASGAVVNNNGTIEGGDGTVSGVAGVGVAFTGIAGAGTKLVNTGTIRGGTGLTGASGNSGVVVNAGTFAIENNAGGTIEGTEGFAAIRTITSATLNVTNSGTISAGAGQANAIAMGGSGALNLELRAGSQINGNVVASSSINDTLKLGGSTDSAFDASEIGSKYLAFEKFAKTGSSTWTLNGTSGSTGAWTIEEGTLALNTTLTTTQMTIAAPGTLTGNNTVIGNVTNAGTIAPNGFGAMTIDGNYTGNGGAIKVNSQLGGDGSSSGKLIVTGATSGTGKIQVTNAGGLGAKTTEGIKVVDVQGASNAAFTLLGNYTFEGSQAIVGGAYAYRLYQNGIATPADGDWYLRSALIAPGGAITSLLAPTVPLYEAYSSVLQNLNQLGTFQQRVGNREWSLSGDALESAPGKPTAGRGAWAHIDGANTHVDPVASTTDADYKVKTWKLEAGVDVPLMENDAGTLVAGPTVHYGTADASVSSRFGDGTLDVEGYGIGGTLTWYGNNGVYVDAQAALSWYDTDIRSSTIGTTVADGNNGRGFSAGIETGQRLPLNDNWTITPQAQLTWSKVRFDSFTDQFGADVSHDNGSSLVARLGLSLDRENKWTIGGKEHRTRVYGITNLYYDFLSGTSAHVADLDVESREQSLWAGIGGGAFTSWDNDRYMLYGELLARTSVQDFVDSHSIGAKVGVRMKW